MEESGVNTTKVPLASVVLTSLVSLINTPFLKVAVLCLPSLNAVTKKSSLSAFTALVPTPFKPTDFWKALLSYLAPVLILLTTSTIFPSGIPRP